MTTKRFLLDLLDAEELGVKERFPPHRRIGKEYVEFNLSIVEINRARELVEKGPDEP
ncbi:MAG: hypothetical protein ABFE07_02290 [Armatimonadia bacterium]